MTLAATVYAKQLFYRGHGLPMWIPEPSEFGAVQIGDVGYIVDGCFYRLFNATKPADHPLNCNGVPASFEPLVFQPSLVHRVNDYLPPGPLCSRSVRDAEVRIGVAAEGVAGGVSYRFTCSEDRGALVVIGGNATKEQVHPNSIFPNYMRKNYESWHALATSDSEHFALDLKPEDIVFVRGWVKTMEWAVAAFLDKGAAHELSIQAGIGSYAHADVKVTKNEQISTSLEWRSGPKQSGNPGQADGGDQCIFLSTYKLKRRALFPATIKAMSQPDHPQRPPSPQDADILRSTTPSPTSSNGSGYTISESPPVVVDSDPLEDILDYILQTSTADIAIASHTCVEDILGIGMSASQDVLFGSPDPRTEIIVDEAATGILRAEAQVEVNQAIDYLPPEECPTPYNDVDDDVDDVAHNPPTIRSIRSRIDSRTSVQSWDEDYTDHSPTDTQVPESLLVFTSDEPISSFLPDLSSTTIAQTSPLFSKPTEPHIHSDDEGDSTCDYIEI